MRSESDTLDMPSRARWWNEISHRVREQDIERQILFNRVRKISRSYIEKRVANEAGVLLPEFLKALLGSGLGFWMISSALAYFFSANPLYTLAAFGLLYSLQSTYHKYRLSVEPEYKIPKCRCAHQSSDDTEKVLRSGASEMLKIPNSVFGAVLYPALVWLVYAGHGNQALLVASLSVLASAWLGYVMIARIVGLCSTCINIFALNLLILWQLS